MYGEQILEIGFPEILFPRTEHNSQQRTAFIVVLDLTNVAELI